MSELSQAPTDDEREALVKKLILESLVFVNSESEPWAQMLANRILSALRRPEQAPTDDEREALSRLLNETDPEGGIDFEDEHSDKQFWFPQADAILAAGFRRRAQAEPTDEDREALAHAIRKGSGASRYQSILLADQILPHLDGFRRHTQAEPTDAQVADYQAEAWTKGHAAGRDYQGDGWNCDAHDPELDNPYRSKSNGSE